MGIRNDVIMSKGTTVFGMALHFPKSADLALTTVLTIFLGVFALVFEHHPALVVTIITGWLLIKIRGIPHLQCPQRCFAPTLSFRWGWIAWLRQ
jgi:hypothetical protein